jgi:hypothetical protein
MGFLQETGAESWKELNALPHYGTDCNAHFFGTESRLSDGTDRLLGR